MWCEETREIKHPSHEKEKCITLPSNNDHTVPQLKIAWPQDVIPILTHMIILFFIINFILGQISPFWKKEKKKKSNVTTAASCEAVREQRNMEEMRCGGCHTWRGRRIGNTWVHWFVFSNTSLFLSARLAPHTFTQRSDRQSISLSICPPAIGPSTPWPHHIQ